MYNRYGEPISKRYKLYSRHQANPAFGKFRVPSRAAVPQTPRRVIEQATRLLAENWAFSPGLATLTNGLVAKKLDI